MTTLAFVLAAGCGHKSSLADGATDGGADGGGADSGLENIFTASSVPADLDVLFLIDDSSSMTPVQQNLVANFPAFLGVLRSLPTGLPNLHLGVITSSMGAGDFTSSVPGCMTARARPTRSSMIPTKIRCRIRWARSPRSAAPSSASCVAA